MLDRTIAPAYNSEFTFGLIQPVSRHLANNVALYFIHGGEQEVIKIELIVPAGKWFEKTTGTSHFTASLLNKGTQTKSSSKIAELLDYMGVHYESHSGPDFVSVSIYSLTKKIIPALTLLLELITEPVFPDKELQQLKSIYLQNLKVNLEKTSFVATRQIRKNLFGPSHPYGRDIEEGDLTSLNRSDIVHFHQHHFFDVIAIVSGKLNEENAQTITELFSTIKYQTALPAQHDVIHINPFAEYIEKEGSVQTSLRLAKQGILRDHPDYAYVLFLNHILGGYFGSRLMKNLREDKGLTYGISSSLQIMKHKSFLIIGTDVNKENRNLAGDEIKTELKKLRTEPVTQEEIDTARNHFIGSFQTELSTAFAHADKVKNILLNNLSEDFYQKLIAQIESIKPEHLQRTADAYFNEETFFEVAVG